MKTIVIIQARMGSSRLPGKILKPLGDADVLTYVTSRCRKIQGVGEVIVATSLLPQDDAVEKWCTENGVACFRGSEDDVLDRYVQCAKQYEPEYVMRVTSDCPFVDYEMANDIVAIMERVDIVDVVGDMPRGLAVELISYEALLFIHENGQEERHREHVTYYAYEYHEQFQRVSYSVPVNRLYPELRVTLDTVEDYALCQAVASHFNNPLVSSSDVIQYLVEHPEVAKLNAHIEQKPVI
ncbi:glycosyltransferase family protein [Sporosarcina sp. FSL K6-2383]|uniref:glycosyltransferase family protein n=1 Tax=Sporosarcina sp. FSL K6-2383 TaxID=2921556 RepID=UPI00315A289C